MNRIFKTTLIAAISFASLTSCLSGDSGENYSTQTFDGKAYFNTVTDLGTNTTTVTKDPYYYVRVDHNTSTIDIAVSNLVLPSSTTPVSVQFKGLKARYTNTGAMSASEIVVNTENNAHTISDLTFGFVNRYFNFMSQTYTVSTLSLNFTVDNQYVVNVVPIYNYLYATTVSTNLATGVSFTTKPSLAGDGAYKAAYCVQINPDNMLAQVTLSEAQFMDRMPAQNLLFPDIPVTFSRTGFSLAKSELTPSSYSASSSTPVPNPSFPVTDFSLEVLTGSITSSATTVANFKCTPAMLNSTFHVNSTLSIVLSQAN